MRFFPFAFLISLSLWAAEKTTVTWTQSPPIELYQNQLIETSWNVGTSRSNEYSTFLSVCPIEAGPHCSKEEGRQQGPKFQGAGNQEFKQTFRFDSKTEAGKFYVVAVVAFDKNDVAISSPIEINYLAKPDPQESASEITKEPSPQFFIILPLPYPTYREYPRYGYPPPGYYGPYPDYYDNHPRYRHNPHRDERYRDERYRDERLEHHDRPNQGPQPRPEQPRSPDHDRGGREGRGGGGHHRR